MADDPGAPPKARTYSVDEVGRIIRRASAEANAAPAPGPEGERLTWDEVREIAGEVGISEAALVRAAEATPEPEEGAEASEAPATGLAGPAAPDPSASAGDHRGLGVDVAVAGAGVLVVGAAGAVLGLGAWPVGAALVVAGAAVALRSVARGLRRRRARAEPPGPAPHRRIRLHFATSTIDLTQIPDDVDGPYRVHVDVAFGDAVILLDPGVPYRIDTSVSFGEARLPDPGRRIDPPAGPPRLVVHLKVVFGNARVTFTGTPSVAERLITAFTGRR